MADPEDPDDDENIVVLKPGAGMRSGHPRIANERGKLPKFRPTDEHRHTVMVLAANGDKQNTIAQALNISPVTLQKYFRKEIKTGRAQITARVGYAVVKEALAGNMGAARYWLLTHGGPEWQLPKEESYRRDPENAIDDDVVHFYMPPNNRDLPEPEDEPPTIDGDVTDTTATGTDDA